MTPTPEAWPIAAGLLQFPAVRRDGSSAQDADPEEWFEVFAEVASAGFRLAELSDSWVRAGDLSARRLELLADAAAQAGVGIPSLAVVRSSIIDPDDGLSNVAHGHRMIDAAAQLSASVVSFGLHRPLTATQREQLWFWTVQGATDPEDQDVWDAAVAGFRELGSHAASVGVQLSLEMYEDTLLGTAESAVRLVQDIGLDNVGLNPDVGNLVRLHRPVESWQDIIEKTAPYTNYWHIKNYFRDEDIARGWFTSAPAPLELGVIDYRWAIKEVLRAGFTGIFVCEHYGGDGLSVGARNQRYIRGLLPSGESPRYVPRPD